MKAPEVLMHRTYDKSCDLWSLGVVCYMLYANYFETENL